MLATSRGCILFGFSFLLFTGASWAQFTAISGDVKDVDGQKLRGAEILIEREGQKGTYKGAKTDKNGHYIYNGLPIGKYTVSVIVGGQTRDQISGVATRLGDPTELNFDLKQAADKQLAQAGSTPAQEQARGMSKEERERLDKQAKENAAILAKNKALHRAMEDTAKEHRGSLSHCRRSRRDNHSRAGGIPFATARFRRSLPPLCEFGRAVAAGKWVALFPGIG